jgi:acetyl esterase/lipase
MNVMEHGWRKKITSLVFPRIAFKRIIYVGHNFKPITAEFIQNQYKAGTINKITRYDNVMLQGLTPCPLKGLFTKTPHTIRVRVLAPARLNFSEPGNHSDLPERNVVLHIHGGGFATLSSRTY